MPSRHFFNRFARSHSPKRKSSARLAREKAQIESMFAPSFPNGMPEPYLWKVTYKYRPSESQESPPGDCGKGTKGPIAKDESAFKMGNMFEGLSDDSEFRMLMGQGVKDPSLASDIKNSPGLKGNSLHLDVIQGVEGPSLTVDMKNGPRNENWSGGKEAQAHKQQAESCPAFLTIPLGDRSKIPVSPKQSPSSSVQRPEDPCSNVDDAIDHSTDPDRLERPKFPAGKHSRLILNDTASPAPRAPRSVQSRAKKAMQTYLARTKVAIRAKPKSVRNSALVRAAASLRRSASHRNRYGTHLPGLMIHGGYRLYRRAKPLKSLMSDDGSGPNHPLIPQIIITPPPEDDEDGCTDAVVDFNSRPSLNSISSTRAAVGVPVSEPETPIDESFDQKLAWLLSMYIEYAQIRNELRREICNLFAEENGTAAVDVRVSSS